LTIQKRRQRYAQHVEWIQIKNTQHKKLNRWATRTH
jgi:hypothetical protein